jgi:hypothetical protein
VTRKKKTIIHVNQHVIKANAKSGERNPVLTVKQGRTNRYAHEAIIRDREGNEVARVVYSPDKPLSCGARVWISCETPVEIVVDPKYGDANSTTGSGTCQLENNEKKLNAGE